MKKILKPYRRTSLPIKKVICFEVNALILMHDDFTTIRKHVGKLLISFIFTEAVTHIFGTYKDCSKWYFVNNLFKLINLKLTWNTKLLSCVLFIFSACVSINNLSPNFKFFFSSDKENSRKYFKSSLIFTYLQNFMRILIFNS